MKKISTIICFLSLLFLYNFSQAQENNLSSENSYVLKADNGKKSKIYAQNRPYRIKYKNGEEVVKARGILIINDPEQIVLQPVTNQDQTTSIPVDAITSISPLHREGRKIITYTGGGVGVLLSAIGLANASGSLKGGEDAGSKFSGFFGGAVLAGMGVIVLGLTGIADLTTLLIEGLSTKSEKKGYRFSIEKKF